jgi:hypothetical protein
LSCLFRFTAMARPPDHEKGMVFPKLGPGRRRIPGTTVEGKAKGQRPRAVSCFKMGKLADRRSWIYGDNPLPSFKQETVLRRPAAALPYPV